MQLERLTEQNPGRITGNPDLISRPNPIMTSGMEATGHEAELTKETHHNKVCPAPARSRACQNRGVEQPHQSGRPARLSSRHRSHLESRQLAPRTVNLRLGAVRRLAYEAADCGLLSACSAAGIRRVKGVNKLGVRFGNWLTAEQGHALWQPPDNQRLREKRDRALLVLLLACGLRRHEVVALT